MLSSVLHPDQSKLLSLVLLSVYLQHHDGPSPWSWQEGSGSSGGVGVGVGGGTAN